MGFSVPLLFLTAALGAGPEPPQESRESDHVRRDVFLRPLPWGPAVGGRKIGLHMTRTRLSYGQPLEVFFRSACPYDERKALNRLVHVTWTGHDRTTLLELTAEDGSTGIRRRYTRYLQAPSPSSSTLRSRTLDGGATSSS